MKAIFQQTKLFNNNEQLTFRANLYSCEKKIAQSSYMGRMKVTTSWESKDRNASHWTGGNRTIPQRIFIPRQLLTCPGTVVRGAVVRKQLSQAGGMSCLRTGGAPSRCILWL